MLNNRLNSFAHHQSRSKQTWQNHLNMLANIMESGKQNLYSFYPASQVKNSAYCTLCKTDFSIGVRGRNGTTRHSAATSAKHNQHKQAIAHGHSIGDFFTAGNRNLLSIKMFFMHFSLFNLKLIFIIIIKKQFTTSQHFYYKICH